MFSRKAVAIVFGILAIFSISISAYAEQTLFEDDFSGDLSQWTVQGDPMPSIVSNEGNPAPCFSTNGDGFYAGLAVTHQTFNYIGNDFTASADVKAGSTYRYSSFGLAKDNVITGADYDPRFNPLIYITIASTGALGGRGITYKLLDDNGELLEQSIRYDRNTDGWHNIKFKVRSSDRRVEFYLDGELVATSTHQISSTYDGNAAIFLGNRLAWHDNVLVTAGNEPCVSGGCVNVGNDLTLTIPCAEYNGIQYGLTLKPYVNPNNPFGFYWELDPNSITVK